jgi:rubrerythrin
METQSRPETVDLLQKALIMEIEDVFLYLREAQLFRRKLVAGERLAQAFVEFALNEMRHVDLLVGYLARLGQVLAPEFTVPPASRSLRRTLAFHEEREVDACALYSRLISLDEERSEHWGVFDAIREEEETHLARIRRVLRHLRFGQPA